MRPQPREANDLAGAAITPKLYPSALARSPCPNAVHRRRTRAVLQRKNLDAALGSKRIACLVARPRRRKKIV